MTRRIISCFMAAALVSILACCGSGRGRMEKDITGEGTGYDGLVALFREFREFQAPRIVDGVPDYTKDWMNYQEARLPEFQRRLADIDTAGWPVSQKVDYEIVRAEMNGLEFDHRVLRPWARDPSFYAVIAPSEPDVPAREGPEIPGVLELWRYSFPLSSADKEEFRSKLEAVPGILEQAKTNLTESGKDLWFFGIRHKEQEIEVLGGLSRRLAASDPDLVPEADRALAAAEDFLAWMKTKDGDIPGSPCGIGIEKFDWYMKNVHLVPATWKEQEAMLKRELERSWASLRLEEQRNRDLPPLAPPRTLGELQMRVEIGVSEFMSFLREKEIFTVPGYMHLDDEARSLAPPGIRDFFTQVSYHDQLPLLCHQIHWLEKQRETRSLHPIRGQALLWNIWDSRAEGLATAFEETLLHAGLMDKNPRARELTWILLAFRAARGMGDLELHSREWTLQEAVDFAVENTPRGWVLPEGRTVWGDLALYLRQPGYGTSYVYGKLMFEKLLAEVSIQKGDDFRLRDFLDDYFSRGIIPASLIRWEMTGRDDEMKALGR
jgi:hypothetical protein